MKCENCEQNEAMKEIDDGVKLCAPCWEALLPDMVDDAPEGYREFISNLRGILGKDSPDTPTEQGET